MLKELEADGTLYQQVAVGEIAERFGENFITINAGGNQAIRPSVLSAFNALTSEDVVWSRSGLFWRKREDFDLPGRQQP